MGERPDRYYEMENTWIFPLRSMRAASRTVWVNFEGPEIFREDVEILIRYLQVSKTATLPFHKDKKEDD